MEPFTSVNDPQVAALLGGGYVGVLRTDTLYGIVCKADDEKAVNRVYELKNRNERKSPIILIASTDQLYDKPPQSAKKILEELWPGPVSIILPSELAPKWLRRDNASIAYRIPDSGSLRRLLQVTGPLTAPSANPEGSTPAMNIDEAYHFFGDEVDFYVDGGTVKDSQPSQLVRINGDGTTERLR